MCSRGEKLACGHTDCKVAELKHRRPDYGGHTHRNRQGSGSASVSLANRSVRMRLDSRTSLKMPCFNPPILIPFYYTLEIRSVGPLFFSSSV